MLRLFWNGGEGRLRAWWRLLLEFAVQLAGIVALSAVAIEAPLFIGLELALTLAIIAVAARVLDRRRFADLGFHFESRWWLDLGFGLVVGAALMVAIFFVERGAGWLETVPADSGASRVAAGTLAAALALNLAHAFGEELLARGYQLKNGAEGLDLRRVGPRVAVVLAWLGTSLFFGLGHATQPGATALSFAALSIIGLFFGLSYILTGELALSIGLHAGWNFVQGRVLGFPVSGNPGKDSIITTVQTGPELWTGGAFGPEGGLISIAACIAGGGLVVAWVWMTRRRCSLEPRIARFEPR